MPVHIQVATNAVESFTHQSLACANARVLGNRNHAQLPQNAILVFMFGFAKQSQEASLFLQPIRFQPLSLKFSTIITLPKPLKTTGYSMQDE